MQENFDRTTQQFEEKKMNKNQSMTMMSRMTSIDRIDVEPYNDEEIK